MNRLWAIAAAWALGIAGCTPVADAPKPHAEQAAPVAPDSEDPRLREVDLAVAQEKAIADGRFGEAASLGEELLAIRQQRPDARPAELANALYRLGYAQNRLGRNKSAEVLLRHAIDAAQNSQPVDELNIAPYLSALGDALADQGEYQGAINALARAERIFSRILAGKALDPGNHRAFQAAAENLRQLGTAYAAQRRYADAERQFSRALAMQEELGGRDTPDVLRTLLEMVRLDIGRGKLADAEAFFRRALEVDGKSAAPDDLTHAELLLDFAHLSADLGKSAAAETLAQRSLAIREKALPPDDPRIAECLSDLSLLLGRRGDRDGAEALSRRALAILEKAFGPDSAEVAGALVNLAGVVDESETAAGLAEAQTLNRRALEIQTRIGGDDSGDVGAILCNMAKVAVKEKKLAEAAELYGRALVIFGKIDVAHGTAEGVPALRGLADVQEMRGNIGAAKALRQQADDAVASPAEPLPPENDRARRPSD